MSTDGGRRDWMEESVKTLILLGNWTVLDVDEWNYGGGYGSRTHDLQSAILALSQLS
tara:strand:+ start:2840 stop:3010 length:171 start_codon:yes stop_codon:yes gene_type:complete